LLLPGNFEWPTKRAGIGCGHVSLEYGVTVNSTPVTLRCGTLDGRIDEVNRYEIA